MTLIGKLRDKFRDTAYRHEYVDSFFDTVVATQIRELREGKKLTQAQLAALADMKQSRISTLENANYSRWNVDTLRRLARVFDVGLVIKFEDFGNIIRQEIGRSGSETVFKHSFDEDPFFRDRTKAASEFVSNLELLIGKLDAPEFHEDLKPGNLTVTNILTWTHGKESAAVIQGGKQWSKGLFVSQGSISSAPLLVQSIAIPQPQQQMTELRN